MFKKTCPILYSKLLYKVGQDLWTQTETQKQTQIESKTETETETENT